MTRNNTRIKVHVAATELPHRSYTAVAEYKCLETR